MKRVLKAVIAAIVACAMASAMFGCSSEGTTQGNTAQSGTTQGSATRTVTAPDGTQVEIPANVTKVAPSIGALAEITMIVSKGEPVISAAATQQISDKFKQYFPRYSEGNPNDYSSRSVEDLVASGTQVVYGVSTIYSDDQLNQLKDAGIAFVPIDSVSTVEDLCNATMLIGEILGDDYRQQAQEFCEYWKGQMDRASAATASVTDKQTILEAMYSSGSFTTVNSSDIMNEYFTAAGLINLAADMQVPSDNASPQGQGGQGGSSASSGSGQGKSRGGGAGGIVIDVENIAQMNPDWIITNSQEGKDALMSNPALANISAIANDHVLVSPQGAYLWMVRSGEGALVPMWLVSQVYPDLTGDYDATEAVQEFFKKFYNYDIDDEAASEILTGRPSAITR